MGFNVGTPASGPLAAIRRAFERLNPCGDLDVDVVAISRAAAISSTADWNAQTLSNVAVDQTTGAVTLAEQTTAATIFSQTTGSSQAHQFTDGTYNPLTQAYGTGTGAEEYALDFFPDPSAFNGVPFTLDSIDLFLTIGTFHGTANSFRFRIGVYDARWRFVPLGDPIDVTTATILKQNPACYTGGVFKLALRSTYNRRITFEPGTLPTRTGAGRDGTGLLRAVAVDSTGASTLVVARGLSISITPNGPGFNNASLGCCPAGTLAGFNPGAFWRYAPNRSMGPYDPDVAGYAASDATHNPDDLLTTGAVPGPNGTSYGAIAGTSGQWGIARRVRTAQRPQDPNNGWHQPYHVLRAVAYQPSGTVTAVLDLGATPTNPVQIRLNDVQPAGTGISYTLAGSNTSASGPWTGLGSVGDGQELTNATGTYLYRWYQLTATLTAGGGTTKYATPALLAWQMVERVTLSTWRYLEDFDADASIDPVTGQSSVAELKLPMLRAGVRGYRDLATQINSQYAPSSIEAHVYARNVVSGQRYFLNSYRLENRDPQDGKEEMTFVGGLDLLSGLIPPSVESYRYPVATGQVATITSVAGVASTNPNPATGNLISVDVAGSPFVGQALAGFYFVGLTGACAKQTYLITGDQPRNAGGGTTSTDNSFVVNMQIPGTSANGPAPAVGDTFEIHSYQTSRGPLTYSGQNYASIAADLLNVQSGVPSRYRGQLPATAVDASGNQRLSGTYTLPSEGVKALDVLSHIGLHCGGAWQWMKGRIQFVDLYGKKDSVLTLDERLYVSLETPLGADRRMPSVKAKYGYQPDTGQFANELQTDDADALTGWGRANLFDVFELPDDVAVWNDATGTEATYLTTMLQGAWKTGVRLWTVNTVFQYPWLDFGDGVTIVTDQYTDRRLAYASDGVTDLGSPVAGRVSAVGVVVGKNLKGDKFIVAIRGLDAITGVTSNPSGTTPILDTSARSLQNFRVTAEDDTSVSYGWTRGALVTEVWVGAHTYATPLPDDPWAAVVSGSMPITGDTLRLPKPPDGYVLLAQIEPRLTDLSVGPVQRVTLTPTPQPPLVQLDDVETESSGTQWWKLIERGIAVTDVAVQTQVGTNPISGWSAPTRGPGQSSTVKGGTLGSGEYEQDITLDPTRFSWIVPRITLANAQQMTLGPFGFDRDKRPNLITVTANGTVLTIVADSDTKSIRAYDASSGGTWEYWIDGQGATIDCTARGTNGVAGMASNTSRIIGVTAYSQPKAYVVKGTTAEDDTSLRVTGPSASSAAASWLVATLAAPPIGSSVAVLELEASAAPAGWTVAVQSTLTVGGSVVSSGDVTSSLSPALSTPPTVTTDYHYDTNETAQSQTTGSVSVRLAMTAQLKDNTGAVQDSKSLSAFWYTGNNV